MEIDRVILRCSDLDRSVEFWRDRVGLEMERRSLHFAFFATGSTQLTLDAVPAERVVASPTEVVFIVEDVVGEYEELKRRGVPFEVEPRPVMGDDTRELFAAHFRDPDGNLASITGWVDL